MPELELQGDRFETADRQIDEKEQAEVVAQHPVDPIVVEEVAQVVEDMWRDAVEDMGGVAGDKGRAGTKQGVGHRSNVCHRLGGHVPSPVRGHEDRVRVEVR